MENLKLNILAIAICSALGLSACDNNANVSNNSGVEKETITQTKLQAEIEQKVSQMARENILKKTITGVDKTSEIYKYMFETFPKHNIRMEPTLENFKWYAEHHLVPPFFKRLKGEKETMEYLKPRVENSKEIENKIFNTKEPNQKTLEFIKDLFFLDDGSFLFYDNSIEKEALRLRAIDAFFLAMKHFTGDFNIVILNENGDLYNYPDMRSIAYMHYNPRRLDNYRQTFFKQITAYTEMFILNKDSSTKNKGH